MHYLCSMKKESAQALYGELGKYLIDISKLVFGGIILAGIMRVEVDQTLLFILGGVWVITFSISGVILTVKSKSQK